MSRAQVLFAIWSAYREAMREYGSVCRALSAANLVAVSNATSLGEAVKLRDIALRR